MEEREYWLRRVLSPTTALVEVWPAAAAPAIADSSATSETYGSWVEALAASGIAEDFEVFGVMLRPNVYPSGTFLKLACQVGAGGAGSEVVIAETAIGTAYIGTNGNVTFAQPCMFSTPVRVAAGTRVAVRFATNVNSATSCAAYVLTQRHDLLSFGERWWATIPGRTSQQPALTTLALTSVTGHASIWTLGSWSQIIASYSGPGLITGLVVSAFINDAFNWQMEIGFGAAASEVAKIKIGGGQFRTDGASLQAAFAPIMLPRPQYVPDATRIAARSQDSRGSSNVIYVNLQTVQLPLR